MGCNHGCYGGCWAKSLHDRWRTGRPFEVSHLNERELNHAMPGDGTRIFVCSTGDLFCSGCPSEYIEKVLERISRNDAKNNTFLLQTKNPTRFLDFFGRLQGVKERVILGTTLETNRALPWKAPPTEERAKALGKMHNLGYETFLSLEPLADFDLDVMVEWIDWIKPGQRDIEIGLENYTHSLPPPPIEKVQALYDRLCDMGYLPRIKTNLKGLVKTRGDQE